MNALKTLIWITSLWTASACQPIIEYEHLSDPRIDGDGYDLICGGLEGGDRLSASVAACHNMAPYGGQYVKVNVRYRIETGN